MKKPHIFISYTNTGSGHIIPALAIAQCIEELYPNQFKITCSDFFEDVGETKFNRYIENSWNILLRNPKIVQFCIIISKILYFLAPYYIKIIHMRVHRNSINYMHNLNPDIVFTTHFFTQGIALDARKKFSMNYPIITLNPDTFETFPQWDRRGEIFLVCSEIAKKIAIKLGHKESTITIVPQALRKEFYIIDKKDPKELRKQYNLRQDVFTILMSDGGQGIGKMYPSIRALLKINSPLNIIAICGKNHKLYKKLLKLQQKTIEKKSSVQFLIIGFADSMVPFIQMSDLFIGKSGPATVVECLKMHLPVLIVFSANSAERKTANFFIEKQVVLSCMYIWLLPKKVEQIMNNPQKLTNIKARLTNLDFFQNGSSVIAKIIIDSLEKKIYNIKNPV
ncbi:MAG: hypothetical protein KFW21_02795 [Spirochaetota bacterium]|nr:hypothetical protein [Spirochaetota bacterium]